jgi:hypothetical protein
MINVSEKIVITTEMIETSIQEVKKKLSKLPEEWVGSAFGFLKSDISHKTLVGGLGEQLACLVLRKKLGRENFVVIGGEDDVLDQETTLIYEIKTSTYNQGSLFVNQIKLEKIWEYLVIVVFTPNHVKVFLAKRSDQLIASLSKNNDYCLRASFAKMDKNKNFECIAEGDFVGAKFSL